MRMNETIYESCVNQAAAIILSNFYVFCIGLDSF